MKCRANRRVVHHYNTQAFDAENRLAIVTNTVTGQVVRFVYDGDGNRVLRRVDGGETTVYIGDYYEREGSTVRKYYYAGGRRIAVRVDGALYFLHSDHLGSATLTTNASGNRVGEARYKPYGEVRQGYPVGVMPTDRLYTGQRWDGALGLYDYRARHYHPALGRFVSADTLVQANVKNPAPYLPLAVSYADPKVLEQWNQLQRARLQPGAQTPSTPSAFDPQFLNRYSYGRNNPLAYVDDSGHIAWWVVGGVVGGVVGFGAYAITHRDNFDWKQAMLWTAGGAVVGATFGAGAQWVAGVLGATASPWALPALQRGQVIEDMLGRSPFLAQNFPVIDRFVNGVATSIKSIDLRAASYQNIDILTRTVQKYVTTLANWQGATWGGFEVRAADITGRELLLAIPPGASPAQMAALQRLQQWAATVGVTLKIVVVP